MSQDMTTTNGNGTSIARQGFGDASLEKRHETSTSAEAARAQAEVQARFIMAMQHPRDDDNVRIRLLKECSRTSFASRAFFSVQRGNKPGRITGTIGRIEGLSVRFAEAAIRHMGNIMVSTRAVYDDAEKRIVAITVIDLETNAAFGKDVVIGKTVERKKLGQGQLALRARTNSYGDMVYLVEATDDELLQKENALVSKTLRTEGLRLLSADTIEECEQKIIDTVKRQDAQDPDAARKALADGFAAMSVMPSDLKAYLGHDLAQCSPAQLTDLRGLYAAIREGEQSWAEIMAAKNGESAEPVATQAQSDASADAPKTRGQRLATRARGANASSASPADAGTPTHPANQPASSQNEPVATARPTGVKPGTPVQMEMPGATVPTGPIGGLKPGETPVVPSSTTPVIPDHERAVRLQEQAELCSKWPSMAGFPVVVQTAGGPVETFTKGPARMHGEIAVVDVDKIDGPVALSQVKRVVDAK
jgi:hypothetical protein